MEFNITSLESDTYLYCAPPVLDFDPINSEIKSYYYQIGYQFSKHCSRFSLFSFYCALFIEQNVKVKVVSAKHNRTYECALISSALW